MLYRDLFDGRSWDGEHHHIRAVDRIADCHDGSAAGAVSARIP